MKKIYILINENALHLALGDEVLVAHTEHVRQENAATEKDYLRRNPHESSTHGIWNTKEITTPEDAIAYYNDIMDGYDYDSMFTLDPQKKMVSSMITNIHTAIKCANAQPLTYTTEETIKLFEKFDATKNSDGVFAVDLEAHNPIEEVPFLKEAFAWAYQEKRA